MATEYKTAFSQGFTDTIDKLIEQTQTLYLNDEVPWVVGYSGGKDSTSALQLVWYALSKLPSKKRIKPVYVISTDTLVENPIVALWVTKSLEMMEIAATEQKLPITTHRLFPEVQDRFWVNLIGRGYPAPRPKFRWCTSRLKINPSNRFINEVIRKSGQVILVLGSRKTESITRAANMEKYEKTSSRELLATNGALPNSWIYTPLADWTNDDVWMYVTQVDNPWGYDNKALLNMYRGATESGECPLVVDTSTPSCGDSRFGCYVCTMVKKDKSMQAMIQNDEEKQWMLPLMNLRNQWLDIKEDRKHRDFRRMNGNLQIFKDRLIHGPYKQSYREKLLIAVLNAQKTMQEIAPIKPFQLITPAELEEIRRIWLMEKHEIEDNLPKIYKKVTGKDYSSKNSQQQQIFRAEDINSLKEICQQDGDEENILFQLTRELLDIEQQHRIMVRRAGLYDALDKAIERNTFNTIKEAQSFALKRDKARNETKI
ncbi:MAG: DNA phosphorothioation system sulfurtransferase DndC [Thiomargarita sp.]|nr:DNA phosphorothioation system sulfurtransferase DndC [Thiomargarita sp.]